MLVSPDASLSGLQQPMLRNRASWISLAADNSERCEDCSVNNLLVAPQPPMGSIAYEEKILFCRNIENVTCVGVGYNFRAAQGIMVLRNFWSSDKSC